MSLAYFLTHPEVVLDPRTRIEDWSLSTDGQERAYRAADLPWVAGLTRVFSSCERKAMETATIITSGSGLTPEHDSALGEMDRSSTGYLPPDEFDLTVAGFFARPDESVRGWETADAAQLRIVDAVKRLTNGHSGPVAFIAHGGIGALLMSHLLDLPITRDLDQPGMGSYFAFDPDRWTLDHRWVRAGEEC